MRRQKAKVCLVIYFVAPFCKDSSVADVNSEKCKMEPFNSTTVDLIAVKFYPPCKLRGVIEYTESLDLSFLHNCNTSSGRERTF